jgi:hybrid cluster-associated redox disulfide protein
MMGDSGITRDLAVDDIMRRWPGTAAVFVRHRMACVGCAIGPFHTVVDAAREYDLPVEQLLAELVAAADACATVARIPGRPGSD